MLLKQLDIFTDSIFHNTIDEKEPVLRVLRNKCATQEQRILELFKREKKPMAWFEVKGFLPDMNDKSLCRALTNLTKYIKNKEGIITREPLLKKTDFKVLGSEGVNCYRYDLR